MTPRSLWWRALALLCLCAARGAAEDVPVTIRGGEALSGKEIRRALGGAPLSREKARVALAALGQRLTERGYLEAEMVLSTPAEAPAVLEIREGAQAVWDTLRVTVRREESADSTSGAPAPPAAPAKDFDAERLERLLWEWCDDWAENGRPFAAATVESLVVRNGRVRAGLRLDPGPLVSVAEVRFAGRVATRESFLRRWIRFRPGRLYRESEWQGRVRRLEQLGLFVRVEEPHLELIPSGDGRALRVWMPVEESRHNRVDAAVGYSGASRILSGFIDFELGNLFGTGREVGLRWDRFTAEESRLRLAFREPLLGPLPVGLRGSLEQEERDTTYTRIRAELLGEASIGWDLTVYAGGEFHRSLIGDEPSERILRTSSLVGGRWETLRTGRWRGGRMEASFRSGRSRIRPPLGGPSRSLRLDLARAEAERFWPLGDLLLVRTAFSGAALSPPDSLPLSEALRLGGTGTVRGYADEQFAARRFGAAQLEVGLGLPQGRVYLFTDMGWYRRFADAGESDIWGVGLGLASETASRAVRLDLGLPRGGTLTEGRLHLRVVSRF